MRIVCGCCVKNFVLYYILIWLCYIRFVICDYNYILEVKLDYEYICGCFLGLCFDKRMGEFYIVDVYFGILKVGL